MEYGMGLNHTDKDTIAILQAEISRLQSEFERLRLSSVELLDAVDRDYNRRTNAIIEHHASEMSGLIKQRDTAHNDAIEAMQAHVKPKSITSWDVKEKDYYYALAYEHMWEDLEVMKR